MRKLLLIIITLFLLVPTQVSASINVEITGNGPGSTSEVITQNNVNSKTTSIQKSAGKTDIRIETNGEVKEYHGEGNTNVILESGDGNNSVSIKSNGTMTDLKQNISSPSAVPEIKEDKNGSSFDPIEFIKKQFDLIVKIFLN